MEILGFRDCYSQISDALATLQKISSLFLLLDVMQLTINFVSFLSFIINKNLSTNLLIIYCVIFVDAIVRIAILTFACGQSSEEVHS